MNSCLHCGKLAGQQCARCKRAYYCSTECKSADWNLAHQFECEENSNIEASVENQWTGLFKDQTAAYINWMTIVEDECDPASEDALGLRDTLDLELNKLKNQADKRFSEDVVNRFADNLKKYGTSSILHDAEAATYKRQLLSGSINEMVRVFGTSFQGSLTKQDYEKALTAHVNHLIDFTETLKDSASSKEKVQESIASALKTAVHVGQVFWGRTWRPEFN